MEKSKEKSENEKNTLKIKAKIMLEELKLKYQNINNVDNEEDILNKIIEFNFNEDKIKYYYDFGKIFDEHFDNSPCFVDEDKVKNIISKFNGDKEKIN